MDNLGEVDLASLELFAAHGHRNHMFELASRYRTGRGVNQDLATAFRWYREAAELVHKRAIFMIGVCYRDGQGVPRNDKEAAAYFKRAAESDHPVALFNVYRIFSSGRGVPKNPSYAIGCLRKAAWYGHSASLLWLAQLLRHGRREMDVSIDIEEALSLDRRRAALGSSQERHNFAHNLRVSGLSHEAYIWYQISEFGDWEEKCAELRTKIGAEIFSIDQKLAETRHWIEMQVRDQNTYFWWRDDNEFTFPIGMRSPRV